MVPGEDATDWCGWKSPWHFLFWIMSWKGMWMWRMRTLQFREGRIGRIPCRTLDCSSSLSADSAELQDLHFRILHCTFHSTLRLCCFWLVAWPARHTCSFTFRDHAVGCASLLSEIGRTPPAWARAFTVSTQQEVLWSSISVSTVLWHLGKSCDILWDLVVVLGKNSSCFQPCFQVFNDDFDWRPLICSKIEKLLDFFGKQQNYWLKIKISPLVTAGHHFITSSAVARMVRMLRPGAPLKWNRETEVFPSKRKLLGVSDE